MCDMSCCFVTGAVLRPRTHSLHHLTSCCLCLQVDLVQADMKDYTGPKHHEAAVYLHSRLAELIQAYSDRHPHRQWFNELSRRDSRRSLE